jgi:uncharacterized protein (TIGR02600 family)
MSRFPQRKEQGITLIIVLAFLVLIAALVIGFFTNAQTEVQAARNHESGVSVKQLVASANQLVTGQILDATKSLKTPVGPGDSTREAPPGTRLTWASQPGMIRTWDDAGQPWRAFKLYSSKNMVVDTAAGPFITSAEVANEVPQEWPAQLALFTDLNSPVLVDDPAGGITRGGRKLRAEYPIVDPGAMQQQVKGFAINTPPGYSGPAVVDDSYDPSTSVADGKTGNPAPMPVAWMYMLKDGTLTMPTGFEDEGLTATWTGAEAQFTPSRDNPIVGRFAFWTDDETCKLNINTASEPTPWDTPRAITIQDLNYGKFQPAKNEYQRFPGHPFMTALSPVFFPTEVLTMARKEQIYAIIPRVGTGGTKSGTVDTVALNRAVEPDNDRLFANVDEFLFQPNRTNNPLLADTARLRRSRFFLTATSRAPEVNAFGGPRISLWPVNSGTTTNVRTAYDRLAAFCSTLGDSTTAGGARQFYFQRASPHSPTADWQSIGRNQQLYRYLQAVTSRPVPGAGGRSFADKWGIDRDQVLTEIFDYVRTTNLRDPQPGAKQYAVSLSNASNGGQVTPIVINDTKGFGRFHTISQLGLHFICVQDGAQGALGASAAVPAGTRVVEAALLLEPFSPSHGWYRLNEEMSFDVRFLTPMSIEGTNLQMRGGVTRLNNQIAGGWHLNGRERGGAGGLRGPVQAFGGGNYTYKSSARPRVNTVAKPTMTFSGGTVQIRVFAGTSASGTPVQTFTLNFPPGEFPVPQLVRTGTVGYPGTESSDQAFWWTFDRRYSEAGDTPHAPGVEYFDAIRRWAPSGGGNAGFKKGGLFRQEDVVRSIVPVHGDQRLIAGKPEITEDVFVPVRDDLWSQAGVPEDEQVRFLHIFSEAAGTHFLFGHANEPGPSPAKGVPGANAEDQLVPSAQVAYHYSRLPEIRPGAGKVFNKWNDFDNGIAQNTDGAFINKPDEGNTAATNSPYAYFAWNYDTVREIFFSPNRLVPSAGMLGSLPTGVKRNQPWQTLLFRPQTGHPGEAPGAVKDHYIMDLFWMPVIEPYAISEPFSTAGKINLNYEIAPFSYIRRATALHGAMKSEEILAIPNAASKIYKLWDHETSDNPHGLPNNAATLDPRVRSDWDKAYRGQVPFNRMRRTIDVDQTLTQFEERFEQGEIFRSATQISEMHLVRDGENLADYRSGTMWQGHLMTGDNTKERPYTNLYAKLTTKSNSYTVHVRAQSLRKAASNDPADWAKWREGRDLQLSEHRGSSLIERYIDPSDPNLPDFTANPNAVVDLAYRFGRLRPRSSSPKRPARGLPG